MGVVLDILTDMTVIALSKTRVQASLRGSVNNDVVFSFRHDYWNNDMDLLCPHPSTIP